MQEQAFKNPEALNGDMVEKPEEGRLIKRLRYLADYAFKHPDDGCASEIRDMTRKAVNPVQSGGILPEIVLESIVREISASPFVEAFKGYSREVDRLYLIAKKVRNRERQQREEAYRSQWKHYRVTLNIPAPFDPENDAVDVELTTTDGRRYWANFITRNHLNYLFEKNKATGECVRGTYFRMPNMIVVDKISDDAVRKTIDDLIENFEIQEAFTQREGENDQ